MTENLTFEALPQITQELRSEVMALKECVNSLVQEMHAQRKSKDDELIGIDEAAKLLHLSKHTIYHKANRNEIKHYKPEGCKHLMFLRSDLMEWIKTSGRESVDSSAILSEIQSGFRRKPKSVLGGK
ncbi:MAG: helix-turn-helix domain-containing protein [Bacteroidales bacterium]|nr:helix-turn-helix domain-containing protein [Bacteroidales bacterium]